MKLFFTDRAWVKTFFSHVKGQCYKNIIMECSDTAEVQETQLRELVKDVLRSTYYIHSITSAASFSNMDCQTGFLVSGK